MDLKRAKAFSHMNLPLDCLLLSVSIWLAWLTPQTLLLVELASQSFLGFVGKVVG